MLTKTLTHIVSHPEIILTSAKIYLDIIFIHTILHLEFYCVFILSAISPYTTGLKALLNPSDRTGTAPTHK